LVIQQRSVLLQKLFHDLLFQIVYFLPVRCLNHKLLHI